MNDKNILHIIVNIILMTAGILIFIASLLPIAEGVIDFGFIGIYIPGGLDITFAKSTITFNFILNKIEAEWFNLNLLSLLGFNDIFYRPLINYSYVYYLSQ